MSLREFSKLILDSYVREELAAMRVHRSRSLTRNDIIERLPLMDRMGPPSRAGFARRRGVFDGALLLGCSRVRVCWPEDYLDS